MARHREILGVVAVALATACHPGSPAMTATERAQVADSIQRIVTDLLAGFEHPDYERIFDTYERGNPLAFAENGMIFPSFDSMAASARAMEEGVTIRASLGQHHVTVLDRDVAVMTAIINGTTTDSAGVAKYSAQAWTGVFHRTAAGWKIAASHESYPRHGPEVPRPGARPRR
jgi:ketosteroid isomerase-like protein